MSTPDAAGPFASGTLGGLFEAEPAIGGTLGTRGKPTSLRPGLGYRSWMYGMPRPAPCEYEMPSGRGTAWSAGTQVNWAAVPFGRPAAAW
jgi:hypothetical protein